MDPIAQELNSLIAQNNPNIMEMLSRIGQSFYFPKGILSQSAEAKEKAHHINATIGIAMEKGETMYLPSVMAPLAGIAPKDSLNYAPSFGLPALRKAWQNALYEKNPSLAGKAISLPIVTCGITNGLSILADMWIDPGDVIILPDMIWGNYNLIFKLRYGATISQYTLFAEAGGFNLSAFEAKVKEEANKRAKITVLLNCPQNPSGYSITKTEGRRIADILTEIARGGTNVIAVADDAYFGLFYEDDILKESIFGLLCDRDPRLLAVKLDGATKETFAWGLRVGFITYGCRVDGDPGRVYHALEQKTAGTIRANISNASHLSQTLVLNALRDKGHAAEKADKFQVLRKRALKVKEVLSDPRYKEAWDVYPFNSGYFMCIRLKSVNAETLRVHLLNKYGVGLISIGDKNLRIAFSCVEEAQVQELFDIIFQGVQEVSAKTD